MSDAPADEVDQDRPERRRGLGPLGLRMLDRAVDADAGHHGRTPFLDALERQSTHARREHRDVLTTGPINVAGLMPTAPRERPSLGAGAALLRESLATRPLVADEREAAPVAVAVSLPDVNTGKPGKDEVAQDDATPRVPGGGIATRHATSGVAKVPAPSDTTTSPETQVRRSRLAASLDALRGDP